MIVYFLYYQTIEKQSRLIEVYAVCSDALIQWYSIPGSKLCRLQWYIDTMIKQILWQLGRTGQLIGLQCRLYTDANTISDLETYLSLAKVWVFHARVLYLQWHINSADLFANWVTLAKSYANIHQCNFPLLGDQSGPRNVLFLSTGSNSSLGKGALLASDTLIQWWSRSLWQVDRCGQPARREGGRSSSTRWGAAHCAIHNHILAQAKMGVSTPMLRRWGSGGAHTCSMQSKVIH